MRNFLHLSTDSQDFIKIKSYKNKWHIKKTMSNWIIRKHRKSWHFHICYDKQKILYYLYLDFGNLKSGDNKIKVI